MVTTVVHTDTCASLVQGPLPLETSVLGERAVKCRAFAKALHYKEEEFHSGPTADVLESLIRCVMTSSVTHQH